MERVSHFRNHYELSKKNHMAWNLKQLKKQVDKESKLEAVKCDFSPTTYELPSEYHSVRGGFQEESWYYLDHEAGR